MPFVQKEPSYDGILWEYRSGKITVCAHAYAFGQFRIQVWCDGFARDPDILGPEF